MTTWNPNRDPAKYPAAWHDAIAGKPGRRLLALDAEPKRLKAIANRFNAFKASLRAHPGHPTAQALAKRRVRLSVETAGGESALWVYTAWDKSLAQMVGEQLATPL